MKPELTALYHLHRFQILTNAFDKDGEPRFPKGFLYAVARGVYPHFHKRWCNDEDPYLELYSVGKDFLTEVITYLDGLWIAKKPIPSFYELEENTATRGSVQS